MKDLLERSALDPRQCSISLAGVAMAAFSELGIEMSGRYRVRDLLLPPSLVSFLRLPLAIAFARLSDRPRLAFAALLAAATTDVVDGFLARRLGQATTVGAVVDGVLDKLTAAVIIGSLIWQERLSLAEACLLGTRELGELPLVIWWAVHRAQRRARADEPRANWLGKAATVIQVLAIVAILTASPLRAALIVLTACSGAVAAALYWRRELRVVRQDGLE